MGCNTGHHCYVDGKNEHFPISPTQSIFWAREIDKGANNSTLERPSNNLLQMLMTQKRQQRKQGKKAQSEQAQPTPAAVVPPAFSAPGPTINYYLGRGPDDREELPRQRSTSRYVSRTPHRSMTTSAPSPPPLPPFYPNPPSSPARGDYTLKDYIDWHIKKQPKREELLLDAYDNLEEGCWMVHDIQQWRRYNPAWHTHFWLWLARS